MNTLTQNTASDTPSFLQFNQFESTGIRELTPEEIELINGACSIKGFSEWLVENRRDDILKAARDYIIEECIFGV